MILGVCGRATHDLFKVRFKTKRGTGGLHRVQTVEVLSQDIVILITFPAGPKKMKMRYNSSARMCGAHRFSARCTVDSFDSRPQSECTNSSKSVVWESCKKKTICFCMKGNASAVEVWIKNAASLSLDYCRPLFAFCRRLQQCTLKLYLRPYWGYVLYTQFHWGFISYW